MAKVVLEFEKPILELEQKIVEMRKYADNLDISDEIKKLEKKVDQLRQNVFAGLTRWQKVQLARHPERPYMLDYVNAMMTDFIELHGDRSYRDDHAVVGGFARLDKEAVMVIGHQKGRDTKSNLYRNFGMMNPEGYRKALRLMKLAEKLLEAGYHNSRHSRRLSRSGSRGTRTGRGNCAELPRDVTVTNPDYRRHYR